MQERRRQHSVGPKGTRLDANPGAADGGGAGVSAPDRAERDRVGASDDAALARRCLAGEVAAWEAFYHQCHPPLLASIRALLGSGRVDPNLVDEIAARVWYAVVADDGALLERFDPGRGARLITFLRSIARDECGRYQRSEHRRRRRELAACLHRPASLVAGQPAGEADLADFFGTLTPAEQSFAAEHLLPNGCHSAAEATSGAGSGPANDGGRRPPTTSEKTLPADSAENGLAPAGISQSNAWQLTRRIQQKLRLFFGPLKEG